MERWQDDAACNIPGIDVDIFFPLRGESLKAARAYCDNCEVQTECLQDGLTLRYDGRDAIGVWGGTSEKERKKIRTSGISAADYILGLQTGTYQRSHHGRPKAA